MGRTWSALVFAVVGLVAGTAAAQGPTEAEVRAVLERVDRAIQTRDLDAVASAVAENAQVSGTLSTGTTVVDRYCFDKREYLALLRDGWAQASDYTYRRANQQIVVSGEVATATADVFESSTVPGGVLRMQTRETVTFERIDGLVVATRIVGDATVPGDQR